MRSILDEHFDSHAHVNFNLAAFKANCYLVTMWLQNFGHECGYASRSQGAFLVMQGGATQDG
jgi:hypothetical protein